MTVGIPCNSCSNGTCANCVGEKLESVGFIQSAKFHCLCAEKGHINNNSKENTNKTMLGSKKDSEPIPKDTHEDPDNFEDDE